MSVEKYKFLYEYSRKSVDEDLDRYKSLDDKAAKFISLLSMAIFAYTAILNIIKPQVLPPNTIFEYLFIFFSVLSYVALASAWSQLFRAIKLMSAPRMPLNNEVINLYDNNELITVYDRLAVACMNCLSQSRATLSLKIQYIEKAYDEIVISAWLITISLVMIFFAK